MRREPLVLQVIVRVEKLHGLGLGESRTFPLNYQLSTIFRQLANAPRDLMQAIQSRRREHAGDSISSSNVG